MRGRTAIVTAALLAGMAAPAMAQSWTTTEDDSWCRDNRWDHDGERLCEVRETTLRADGRTIRVDGNQNGGIQVEGWDRSEILLRAKVQAWDRRHGDAGDLLADIDILTGSAIQAEGPDPGDRRGWSVSFELMVPRRSDLDLRTINGGIRISDVLGEVRFDAKNGAIHLDRMAGDVKGHTTNGGLHIDLDGREWDGQGLDVDTTNGGVNLVIPAGYSAELTAGTTNGSVTVDFPVTVSGRIGKRINATLGRGGAPVRILTTNGGVKIRQS